MLTYNFLNKINNIITVSCSLIVFTLVLSALILKSHFILILIGIALLSAIFCVWHLKIVNNINKIHTEVLAWSEAWHSIIGNKRFAIMRSNEPAENKRIYNIIKRSNNAVKEIFPDLCY